ncbi:MAG: hypothetical protein ACRD6X_02725 [Pyrinomonadaceae bacterium]
MKFILSVAIAIIFVGVPAFSQSKSNVEIRQQMRALRAENNITLSHDAASNMSKLMAVSENFTESDARKADIQAMNFAAGFFYAGDSLEHKPKEIQLTFWVLSKKPRFGTAHSFRVFLPDEILDLGDSRYVARTRDNMEYLNFNISREDLSKIASNSNVRFELGRETFTFTKDQLQMLANLLLLSDAAHKN